MNTNESIVRLVINREIRDFWGVLTMESAEIGYWADTSELKSLIKKGFGYALKKGHTGFLVVCDEHTYGFYAGCNEMENGTITMTKTWNHSHQTDDPVTMNPTVARRALYKMAEATGGRSCLEYRN